MYIGSREVKKRYIGSREVKKTYIGSKLVYQSQSIVTDGLVLWLDGADFKNDPATNPWLDKSGKSNSAVPSGLSYTATSGSDGKGAVVLDGTNDYLAVNDADSIDLTGDMTLEVYFYLGLVSSSSPRLISKRVDANNTFLLALQGNGNSPVASIRHNGVESCLATGALTANTYYHLVVRYKVSGGTEIIINNAKASGWADGMGAPSNNTLNLGHTDGGAYFKGGIKQLRIYNRALTDDEITKNYNDCIAVKATLVSRVAFYSDIHEGESEGLYGLTSRQRQMEAVNFINAEHAVKPLDAVVINSDICDNDLTLPAVDLLAPIEHDVYSGFEMPHYCVHGSHECYTEAKWQALFGYSKNYSFVVGDYLFIVIDNFGDDSKITPYVGFGYSVSNTAFIQAQIDAHPTMKGFFLVSHYFSIDATEAATISLLDANAAKFVCGIEGHLHSEEIFTMGSNGRKWFVDGHFSTYFPTNNGAGDPEHPWSYLVVNIYSDDSVDVSLVYGEHTYPYGHWDRTIARKTKVK